MFKKAIEPKILVWDNARISSHSSKPELPMTFQSSALASLRAFRSHEGYLNCLALVEHLDRFFCSAKLLQIDLPYSYAELFEAIKAVLQATNQKDQHLQMMGISDRVIIQAWEAPFEGLSSKALSILDKRRGYPDYDLNIKTPVNYLGFEDGLILNNQGYIVSATSANLFIVRNGLLVTNPSDGSITSGITRSIVCGIFDETKFKQKLISQQAGSLPLALVEKYITKSDLFLADEVFITSSNKGIESVTNVNERAISKGQQGVFTNLIHKTYESAIRGKESYRAINLSRI